MTGEVTVGTSTASTTPEEFRQQIFDATMAWLRGKKDPWKILDWLEEVITAQLLRRESDADYKAQIIELFVGMRVLQEKQPEEQRLTWTLAKAEKILNDVLLAREQIAIAAQAAAQAQATQEDMARRAADVMAMQTGGLIDRPVRTGADAPRVGYDPEADRLILPEEEQDKTVRLISPDELAPEYCDPKNFPDFVRKSILYRVISIVRFFQKTNVELTRDMNPLPFMLSGEFSRHLERAISEMIFPAMQMSWLTPTSRSKATESIFIKQKDWKEVDTDTFWSTIDAADRKLLQDRWTRAWDHVTRIEDGKTRGSKVASADRQNLCGILWISDVTETLRVESDFSITYVPPRLDVLDMDFFYSLISMDHHQIARMEKELEKVLAIYQQEFDPTMLQQKATEGATRDIMGRIIKWEIKDGPFPKYLSNFFALMVYRVCPGLSTNFIRGIVNGYKSDEQMRQVPYLALYARERKII